VATALFPSYAIQHHLSGDSREHKIERKGSEENFLLGTQSTQEDSHGDIEGGNHGDAAKRRHHAFSSAKEAHHSATSHFLWASTVGIIGGCATMLTNSMGPILNVYLLSVAELSPQSYVGTRAMFFCFLNLGKVPMRVMGGTLGAAMLPLVVGLGLVSVLGVLLAKPIMLGMNEKTFVRLELGVVAFAAFRLCYLGIKG
jgi:uncharacterized membrane protein YfcA